MKSLKEGLDTLFVAPRHYTQSCSFADLKSIKIYDSTLRDGEQMAGVALAPDTKYLIARELSDIGCHIIDLGFPASSPGEQATLQLVLQGKRKGEIREDFEILIMCRATQQDIDTTIKTIQAQGFSANDVTFLIFTASSYLHCKYKLGPSLLKREGITGDDVPLEFYHQANKNMIVDAIRYAKSRGVSHIEFGAEDASRTPLPQLIDLVQATIDAGAQRYNFADTTGSLTPESTRVYCQALTKAFPHIERATHFHNDFGLATINVVTGLMNGFSVFTTTANGIGERAGNAALHSVVASLRYLYGIEIPGFRYDRLWRLKNIVERATGVPVPPQEPVIGHNVFSHESGIHTHGVSIARCMYEPIPIEEVGGQSKIVYGKHSGTHGVMDYLEKHADEINCPQDHEFAVSLLEEIKALREARARNVSVADNISSYYRDLDSLGIGEQELAQLARALAAKRISRAAA